METRTLKVIFSKAGGNASKNALATKISLPKKWIDEMDLTKDDRCVDVTFNNNDKSITIKKN